MQLASILAVDSLEEDGQVQTVVWFVYVLLVTVCLDGQVRTGSGAGFPLTGGEMAVSTLFVTAASTETLNGTIIGVTCARGRNKSYNQNRIV